jgi:hypothetical protein
MKTKNAVIFFLLLSLSFWGYPAISLSNNYPLSVQVKFDPQNLNLASQGNWITAFISPPQGYSLSDINENSIALLGSLAEDKRVIADKVLIVKFPRQEAINLIRFAANCSTMPAQASLIVKGELSDGATFAGTGEIFIHAQKKCTDTDGDCFAVEGGNCGEVDCDDNDANVYPNGEEICADGIDNNCDGLVDDDCPVDLDFDGYLEPDDCNDRDPLVYPGANEICDTVDNNCNGLIDEDFDGDGYGPCENDCNENDPLINPDAADICDGIDNNCNTEIDEGSPDLDGDGFAACGGDCNDADDTVHPRAREICDGIDNNCNGLVDEDYDNDGYSSCDGDCNDNISFIYPGAEEVCDRLDNDCDGDVDEGFDLDGDGFISCDGDCDDLDNFTNPKEIDVCWDGKDNDCDGRIDEDGEPEICDGIDNNCDGNIDEGFDVDEDGYTICQNDCDDDDVAVNPGVAEICDDAIDNNCDGRIDCYVDMDRDGYDTSVDFDDTNPQAYPNAPEIACDGIDQDGDGKDSCRFRDQDNGTVLDTKTGLIWLKNASCVGDGTYYQVEERTNNLEDGECGLTDGSWAGDWRMPKWEEMRSLGSGQFVEVLHLSDAAGDGFWSQNNAFTNVMEGASNTYWTSGVDTEGYAKCLWLKKMVVSPYTIYYFYLNPTRTSATWNGPGNDRAWPVRDSFQDKDSDGFIEAHDDCDDNNPFIHPGVPELCDGIDNDCDGRVDEVCDYDGDGFTPEEGDCDDRLSNVKPGVLEVANNGLDDNCNGCLDCRFEDMRDGTVADTRTGLRWLKDTMAIAPTDHGSATFIVNNLQNGQYGLSDGSKPGNWRIPSAAELMSLVDDRYENPSLSNAQGDRKWSEGDAFLHVDDRIGECLDESTFFGGKIYYWTSEYADWKCCDCGSFPSKESCGYREVTPGWIPIWGGLEIIDSGPSYRVVDLNKGYSGTEICNFWLIFGCVDWGWVDNAICGYNNVKVWPVRNN